MRRHLEAALVATLLSGTLACATAYQAKSGTGGYSETWLSDSVVRVSFQGNGFTQSDRADQLLLRRCAEITLERGRRFFAISDQGGNYGTDPLLPHGNATGSATIRLLESAGEVASAADALLVVEQTNKTAGGVLSAEARAAIARIRAGD
ncbi:MAG: hypothetical protein F9K16_01795 [Thermoanaerobaculia bacterium]|nr:MAG: hypothetical protein F9K16_01795 [Thermoanaerobaculia bacterium]MBZ0102673.1 hypothetical protein [Thermoanaerobaculia bacterium]